MYPESASARAPGLDLLRAAAIATVMLYHLASHGVDLPLLGRHGWIGVDLFFVLSGYLIGWQLLRQVAAGARPDWTAFFVKRALRVLPPYLAVLALYLAVPAWREADAMAPTWQFLTFTVNLFADYARWRAYSHAWSLCVEEHFYLLFPGAVWLLARARGRGYGAMTATGTAVAVLVIGGMLLRAWLWRHEVAPHLLAHDAGHAFGRYAEAIYAPTWCRLDGLLAGVLLAAMRAFRPAWWTRLLDLGPLLPPAGALALCAALRLNPVGQAAAVVQFPLVALGCACLLAAALSPRLPVSRIALPGARPLALLAFSLYLTHRQVYAWLDGRAGDLAAHSPLLAFCAYNLAALAVAALLWLAVERPALAVRERLLERRSDGVAPAPLPER